MAVAAKYKKSTEVKHTLISIKLLDWYTLFNFTHSKKCFITIAQTNSVRRKWIGHAHRMHDKLFTLKIILSFFAVCRGEKVQPH